MCGLAIYPPSSLALSLDNKIYQQKATWGRKEFVSANSLHSILEGGQGRNRSRSRGGMLLSSLLNLLSQTTKDCLPRGGTACPQWAGPFHSNHQSRKCTTGLPTGQSGGDIFSIEVPSSQMTLACVSLVLRPFYLRKHALYHQVTSTSTFTFCFQIGFTKLSRLSLNYSIQLRQTPSLSLLSRWVYRHVLLSPAFTLKYFKHYTYHSANPDLM